MNYVVVCTALAPSIHKMSTYHSTVVLVVGKKPSGAMFHIQWNLQIMDTLGPGILSLRGCSAGHDYMPSTGHYAR